MEDRMSYIKTRPPVGHAETENFIDKLRTVQTRTIDGVVVSNLVRACYECGLKSGELINLTIGDVSKGAKVNDSMLIDGTPVPLTSRAQKVLQDHLDHLKANGYKMYSFNPLSPTKKGHQYSQKSLDNHLKKGAVAGQNITLDKIRQAGICRHYDQMRKEGFSAQECLNRAKVFARLKSYRSTNDILRGSIQPTGQKTTSFIEHLKKLEIAELSYKHKNENEVIRSLNEIRDEIIKDKKLNDKERAALTDYIDSSRFKDKNESHSPEKSRNDQDNTSLVDLIKNHQEKSESYPVDDIIEYFELDKADKLQHGSSTSDIEGKGGSDKPTK